MADKFAQHKDKGNDFYRASKYHDAIREYTKCTELDHTKYLPFANRAMCYLKIGKYKQAESDCTNCLQLSPKYVKAYLRRGAARKALGKFQLSLRDYTKALKLQPKNTQASQELNGLKQIISTKQKFIKTNRIKNKQKRQTKIRKISAKIESDSFKQLFENSEKQSQSTKTDSQQQKHKIFYGQLVVGPPGSGKTTYCNVIQQYMTNVLHRNVAIINLDPNNENMSYHPLINITELITAEEVSKNLSLGPNGSLIYCLEYLSENMQWLRTRLDTITEETYLIFDCPGQIELYIHHTFMRRITDTVVNEWHYRIACVNLVDCHHLCSDLRTYDSSNFISVALMTTAMMLHLELPHINVLSKCDLLRSFDESILMPMEFYTEGHDLERLCEGMSEETDLERKFKRLNNALAQCINEYGLISFVKFSINSLETMKDVCKCVDKSNGYDLIGEYYKQMEMEQKILQQRRDEMNEESEEMGLEMVNENENESDKNSEKGNAEIFSVNNPLYQNTPFTKITTSDDV